MKHGVIGSMAAAAALVAVVSLMVPAPAAGQVPAASRRNPPRLANGQPDMQGLWVHAAGLATHSVEDGRDPTEEIITGSSGPNPIVIVEPADGRIPYQPAAAVKRNEFLANTDTPTKLEHIDTHARALLDGVPRNNYGSPGGGLQIVQVPGYVLILYESNHAYRVIPMDGHPHVGGGVKLWMGDSRGRWEGNTLVVDVTNFNDETWFDGHGSFHSDALHVVEHWTMVNPDRIAYEATIEDPKVFTRPWKIAFPINRRTDKGYEQWEDSRQEGERDVEHTLSGGKHDKEAGRTGMHEHRRAR